MVRPYTKNFTLTAYLGIYAADWLLDHEADFSALAGFPQEEHESKWKAWTGDLAQELEAALDDRLLEWTQARNAGLPLGEFARAWLESEA